jgi:hypothetical protein
MKILGDDATLCLDRAMQEQFEQLRQSLLTDIDKMLDQKLDAKLAVSEQKLGEKFAAAEKRLSDQFKIHSEDIRQIAKTTAENYGGVLEGIERRLADMNRTFDAKFGDHDRLLQTHDKRITALEKS